MKLPVQQSPLALLNALGISVGARELRPQLGDVVHPVVMYPIEGTRQIAYACPILCPAVAAEFSFAELFNPAPNPAIQRGAVRVLVDRVSAYLITPATGIFRMVGSANVLTGGTAVQAGKRNYDLTRPGSTAVIGAASSGGLLAAMYASLIGTAQTPVVEFIRPGSPPYEIGPGRAMHVQSEVVNVPLMVTFEWREEATDPAKP